MKNDSILYWYKLEMYKNWQQAEVYCEKLSTIVKDLSEELTIFIIPSYVYLDRIKQLLCSTEIEVGAQNMHWEREGLHRWNLANDVNIDLVELGHSERRMYYHETMRL